MTGSQKTTTKKTIKPTKDIVMSMVEDFKEKLVKIINQDIKELVIDMKNINNIDSSGLGVLIAAKKSLEQTGGQINLNNVPENIESLLQVLGLDKYFNPGTM